MDAREADRPAAGRARTPRRILPLMAVGLLFAAATAHAQSSFPAPLPGQTSAPVAAGASPFPPPGAAPSAFPPVGGGASYPAPGGAPMGAPMGGPPMGGGFGGPSMAGPPPGADACMKEFLPMREDAEKKAKMIKAASDRKAPPDEACKLLANFDAAQVRMLKFVTSNAAKCGIPPQIADQLKAGHANVDKMKTMVCKVAEQRAKGGGAPAPSLSEALGSAASLPEVAPGKKGGATFDTLSGNVMTR